MKRQWMKLLGSALLIVGAAAVFWCAWQWHESHAARQQTVEYLHQQQTPKRPAYGMPVGQIEIPRLHLSVAILEGDDDHILSLAAGHIPETALPGQQGNVGIAAHRELFFRPLRGIRKDDEIDVRTPSGVHRYQVTGTEVVRPSNVQVLAYKPGRDLTLVTCYPFYYYDVRSAPERFIVHAAEIRTAATPPVDSLRTRS